MGYKIIFSPQAIADLETVVRHITKDNSEAAARMGNALLNRATILENFPLIGSVYPGRPDVRKLISRPYLIFYRVREKARVVEILRYWHGAQGQLPKI